MQASSYLKRLTALTSAGQTPPTPGASHFVFPCVGTNDLPRRASCPHRGVLCPPLSEGKGVVPSISLFLTVTPSSVSLLCSKEIRTEIRISWSPAHPTAP